MALTAGGAHTCTLAAGGAVRCWGSNFSGELGDGTLTSRSTPMTVVGLAPASGPAAGGTHTCAIVDGGAVRWWGANVYGPLGDGATMDRVAPVGVLAT